MEPLNNDDRLEHAIRHPKLFDADAREGRSRRFVSIVLFLMGTLFVMAFGVWFASSRETAAESSAQAAAVRSHSEAPATASTVYLEARRTALVAAAIAAEAARHGQIYKCLGKSGKETFQQLPCPSGSKTDRVIPFVTRFEPARAQPYASSTADNQVVQYQNPDVYYAAPAPIGECKAAENFADGERKRLGIHATLNELRYLQDYVYDRCKPH